VALAAAELDFGARLAEHGWPELRPGELEIVQLNVGKLCNMACRHCHVGAGPHRTAEQMTRATMEACLRLLDSTGAHTLDLTGGAPELNRHFRWLVDQAVTRGKHVIDRCNLTVLFEPGMQDLPAWLAERGVEVVCSLPHFRARNTDALRGQGTFTRSIEALRRLNAAGYGQGDPRRVLTVMANPAGSFLAGEQASLQREFQVALGREFDVSIDRLIALNNMPIGRYLEWLDDRGQADSYLGKLVDQFNPGTVSGLMCRNTVSISWDGLLYDCDFNQMLDLPLVLDDGTTPTIETVDPATLAQRSVVTRHHCFGCTAGCGSSCAGATAT
jgi:radical SAM/Cys-rich protein